MHRTQRQLIIANQECSPSLPIFLRKFKSGLYVNIQMLATDAHKNALLVKTHLQATMKAWAASLQNVVRPNSHFTDEKTKVQTDVKTCLRPSWTLDKKLGTLQPYILVTRYKYFLNKPERKFASMSSIGMKCLGIVVYLGSWSKKAFMFVDQEVARRLCLSK